MRVAEQSGAELHSRLGDGCFVGRSAHAAPPLPRGRSARSFRSVSNPVAASPRSSRPPMARSRARRRAEGRSRAACRRPAGQAGSPAGSRRAGQHRLQPADPGPLTRAARRGREVDLHASLVIVRPSSAPIAWRSSRRWLRRGPFRGREPGLLEASRILPRRAQRGIGDPLREPLIRGRGGLGRPSGTRTARSRAG